MKHSSLSASGCERWWNCPGSVKACENIPNPPTIYTAGGTVAHSLCEAYFKKKQKPEKRLGEIIEQDGFEIEVTQEMVDAVWVYIEYIENLVKAIGKTAVVRFEQKVELTEVNSVLFGTADCVIIHPYKCVHVIDFKYGAGKRVHAWRNKQMMYYALGVMLKEDVKRFRLHIIQPRVEDGVTDYAADTDTEMDEFHAELKEHVEAALDPKAPLVPGDWCKGTFCPYSKNGCPALSALSHEVVAKDFSDIPVVQTLTIEQIKKVLKYEDTVKDWMAKVRDHAKELMVQGTTIPGYKVVKAQGNAKWVDEKAVIADFEGVLGDAIYTERKIVSPSQLEKLVGKKKLGPTFRDEYTVRPDNGYKIVEEGEAGETVAIVKAKDDFDE